MLNDRMNAGRKLAAQLLATEDSVDRAIAEMGQLAAEMPRARADAKVSPLFGQEAMEAASSALQQMVEARRKLGEAHTALDEVKTGVGLRTRMLGGGYPKPLEGKADAEPETAATGLRIVGDA